MYHSITFGDGTLYPKGHEKEGQFAGVNTWEDWHLIPPERPSIASPGVSTNFVDIPGRDGTIDMTNFLTGRPLYGDRSGSWDFYVDNDHEYWETIRMKIMTFLHGKRMKIVLEDDPEWYWEGRFAMDNWRSEPSNSKITINYVLAPYKRRVREEGLTDIVWDTFCFESGYDYFAGMNDISLSSTPKTIEFVGYDFPFNVYVKAGASSSASVVLNGGSAVSISANQDKSVGRAKMGANTITLTGSGTATVHFTGGSL